MPQCRSFVDENGAIIVDFIGKVEQIEEDFRHITNIIGLPETDLERKNRSHIHISQPPLLKESDYEYLYELYKKDFDILGYDPNLRL